MALIKCNKCGKEVSDKADTCPYCDVIINPDAQVGDYKCNNCGAPVKEDDESCPECGAVFVEDEDEKNKQNCVVDNIEYTSSENFFKPFPLGAVIFIGVFLGIFLSIYYDTDIGIFFMMLFGIFICSIVILPNYLIKKNKRDDFLQYSKKKIDKIINSNQSYVSLTADVKGIAINDVSKIITIYNGVYEKPIKLKYKDILSFELIEDETINLLLKENWINNANFSQRIWNNSDKLGNYLRTHLTAGYISGRSIQKISKDLSI